MTGVADTSRRVTARTWWLLAGSAAALSLGLGWDWYYYPVYGTNVVLTPGTSVLLADGTIEFTPGSLLFLPDLGVASGVIPGYASHARVLVAVAVLLFGSAVRRGSRSRGRLGLTVAALAPLLAGRLTQGSAIFLVGLGCAALALQANGLLELPRRRR